MSESLKRKRNESNGGNTVNAWYGVSEIVNGSENGDDVNACSDGSEGIGENGRTCGLRSAFVKEIGWSENCGVSLLMRE